MKKQRKFVIEDTLNEAIRQVAFRLRISESELIRRAIREHLEQQPYYILESEEQPTDA
jgi:hypothetical protein